MQFGLLDGRGDADYSGVGLVEISEIFVTQDDFAYEKAPFDPV